MFSGVVIGLLVAISAGTWVYTKTLRRTGGNAKNSAIVAIVAALIAFMVVASAIGFIDSALANS